MSYYYKLGRIPKKRHTTFRKEDGELFAEELFGTEGFAAKSSLLYHLYPPTMVKTAGEPYSVKPKIAVEDNMKSFKFKTFNVPVKDDYIESRTVLFINSDVSIGLASPRNKTEDYFFKNADADEMLFIHKGSGLLKTAYGSIEFGYGDYVIIPRGTVYKLEFETTENKILFVESNTPIDTPKRYKNEYGQYLEHSPFCERDIRIPENLVTHDEDGEFVINIKKNGIIYPYTYAKHPFDLVGWDGCCYPYAFNILDFEPLTGRIHMPPPIHQTFEAAGYVICSFVPRLYDYHPDAIPAPYHHSNIDSDELLYYVDGDFMSRNDIEPGDITLHPGGIPHGPHPGAIERSIGQKDTQELAVMVDPFKPVQITEAAMEIAREEYYLSWDDRNKLEHV